MLAMQPNTPKRDEMTIDEVMALTGRSRDTVMRWRKAGRITARVADVEFTQRQRRLLFQRSEIESLMGAEAERAGQSASVDNHALTG